MQPIFVRARLVSIHVQLTASQEAPIVISIQTTRGVAKGRAPQASVVFFQIGLEWMIGGG